MSVGRSPNLSGASGSGPRGGDGGGPPDTGGMTRCPVPEGTGGPRAARAPRRRGSSASGVPEPAAPYPHSTMTQVEPPQE